MQVQIVRQTHPWLKVHLILYRHSYMAHTRIKLSKTKLSQVQNKNRRSDMVWQKMLVHVVGHSCYPSTSQQGRPHKTPSHIVKVSTKSDFVVYA